MDMDVGEGPPGSDDGTENFETSNSAKTADTAKGMKCPVKGCQYTLATKKALIAHKLSAHSFCRCSQCSSVFQSSHRLSLHIAHQHPHSPPSVPVPSLMGRLQNATLTYLRSIKAEDMYKKNIEELVKVCAKEGMSLAILMHAVDVAMGLPETTQPPIEPPESDECSSPLRRHRSTKRRKRRKKDDDDSSFSPSLPSKNNEPAKRRGPKPSEHVCERCSQVFPYKKDLKAHEAAEHSAKRTESEFDGLPAPELSGDLPNFEYNQAPDYDLPLYPNPSM